MATITNIPQTIIGQLRVTPQEFATLPFDRRMELIHDYAEGVAAITNAAHDHAVVRGTRIEDADILEWTNTVGYSVAMLADVLVPSLFPESV